MAKVTHFFNDRRGVAAIDYCFIAMLAFVVRDVANGYGDIAGSAIKHALGVA